jgi:SAM-dependent methyltransferase
MPYRTAGAPRLIEATTERIVPWARDAQVIYEHYHRYLWTQPLVAGRRVLDLGSGEGFGAALLADTAAAVTGVDVDERAVAHSRANYQVPSLAFREASATDLSAFRDGSFDVVVAFEMIEHVAEHEQVLAEIARVLAPGGILVMSTPERRAYSDDRDFVNPHHVRELTQEEFNALLRSRFTSLALFAQRAVAGSRIEMLGGARGGDHRVRIERVDGDWRVTGPPSPLYLVAVAGSGALPELPGESSLFDYGLEVVAEHQETIDGLVREIRNQRERFVVELEEKNELLIAEQARAQQAELAEQAVKETVAWRLHERLHPVVYRLLGEDTVLGRALRRVTTRIYDALR